ncbi:type II secretion system secretin GspD [Silvanigrella aquatica]|uniref:Type II secretion system protein GspD n=1 Tax=Silvanigrella aquatica TaxID=1915309 RepID=A0A1L4CZB1_9BACT|nr:type II secretion system secretin GspD [Silvanigrella aquatica]APJ03277.1 type II secretion system protein GspD [Silvanigrella aquatica]
MNQKLKKKNKFFIPLQKEAKGKRLQIAIAATLVSSVFHNALIAQTPPIAPPNPTPAPPSQPLNNNNSSKIQPSKPKSTPQVQLESSKKSQSDSIPHGQDLVTIDFPNGANLSDLIKTVGMWTGKNFVLAQGVAGSSRISIISPEPVTKEEAYQAFLSALNISGFTTVDTGSIVKILPIANAKSSNIKTYYGENWSPSTDEIINQVIPLRYIDANSVINQLRPLLGVTQYAAFTTTNSLILTDTGNRIRRILEVIKLLDSKVNQPVVSIIPINYMDSKDTVAKVNDIFGNKTGPSLSVQKVLADERTNSVILVGPASGLDDVVRFIQRIDKPAMDQNSQTMVRVRPLDYADAEKLAQTLQALTQSSKNQNSPYRPPFYPPPPPMPGTPGGSSTTGQAVADLNGVKVTADKATNSLVIQGTKSAYDELDNIIAQLDKRRAQVYVEANIIDLNIDNGFEWSPSVLGGSTVANGRYTSPFGFNAAQGAPLFFNQTGQTPDPSGLMKGAGQQALLGIMSTSSINLGPFSLTPGALIFALKTDTNSNVLQTPSMMVSDNEPASFSSNQEYSVTTYVPNPTSSGGTVAQNQKYTVTTALKVTPQISRADFVSMKINLQLDDSGPPNAATGYPNPISKRTAESLLVVQNGQTAVIGGLTQDRTTVSEAKVPLLGDIPILGWLFKTSTNKKVKTSLTLLVTPHIVRKSEDLEKIYLQKIKDRDEFLKVYYGSKFKDEEFYSKLPDENAGKAPQPKNDDSQNNKETANPLVDGMDPLPKKTILPSEDPNPINAPSSNQSGGGGFGFPQSAPPPPPPPFNNN